MTTNRLHKLNSELIRSKEMDFYKYHTFLNHMNEVFEKNLDQSGEAKSVLLSFTREIIERFVETYGVKHMPQDVRKSAQDIIIQKEWNFN